MSAKLTAIAAAMATIFAVSAAQSANTARQQQALSNAKISLTQAVSLAQEQGGGQAISANYDLESGAAGEYQLQVLGSDGNKLTKYRVDPNTGKITAAANEPFEKLFTRLKPTSIQNAPTSLTRAITAAEQRAGGKATDAAVDRDGDQVQYTVKVAKADGTTEKLRVNGADGKVASAR